ncbi:hypothetical protein [Streptomyces sp. NPDC050534]|uniref:hypothetical protein n=1 Tax=Streptomyces sp. NPDC050534 TaxID=3365625 RepID=UPI0037B715AA
MTPMPPDPCDTATPDPGPVPPHGWWDLRGQVDWPVYRDITDVRIALEEVL